MVMRYNKTVIIQLNTRINQTKFQAAPLSNKHLLESMLFLEHDLSLAGIHSQL